MLGGFGDVDCKPGLEALEASERFDYKSDLEALEIDSDKFVFADVHVIFHLRSYLHDWIHMNIFFHEFHRLIRV